MDGLSINFKEILMTLLEDKDIKRKVIDLVETEYSGIVNKNSLDGQIAELRYEIEKKDKELEKQKVDNQKLQEDNDKMSQEQKRLQEEIECITNEKQLLETKIYPVQELAELWMRLMKLDEEILKFLDSLIGCRDIRAYIVLGKEMAQIKQLWQFIKDKAIKESVDENTIEVLSEYFDMCIEIYNLRKQPYEKLEKIDIEEGAEYNSEYCIKTSRSTFNGEITKVFLNGYMTSDKKKVFFAIVKVE